MIFIDSLSIAVLQFSFHRFLISICLQVTAGKILLSVFAGCQPLPTPCVRGLPCNLSHSMVFNLMTPTTSKPTLWTWTSLVELRIDFMHLLLVAWEKVLTQQARASCHLGLTTPHRRRRGTWCTHPRAATPWLLVLLKLLIQLFYPLPWIVIFGSNYWLHILWSSFWFEMLLMILLLQMMKKWRIQTEVIS